MGNAFHRKKMADGRGLSQKGTGVRYLEPAPVTPEQRAEREAALRQLSERRSTIQEVVNGASLLLGDWKEDSDAFDTRLRNFSGWSTAFYCELPVDAEIAGRYIEVFRMFQQIYGPLSLSQLNSVVEKIVGRNESTERVVEMAKKEVEIVAESYILQGGTETSVFVSALRSRAERFRGNRDTGVDIALEYVADGFEAAESEREENNAVQE